MDNNLKTFRKEADLTQEELAKIVKVTSDYISMIERGVSSPGFKLAAKISTALNHTIEEIFLATQSNKTFD